MKGGVVDGILGELQEFRTTLQKQENLLIEVKEMLKEKHDALMKAAIRRDHLSVDEFGDLTKRTSFTVRGWIKEGRIHATKQQTKSGPHFRWCIAWTEYERYRRDGLLPRR